MSKETLLKSVAMSILLVLVFATADSRAQVKVGDEAPSFTLPSSRDKLVDYDKDYYGKHHLVMTFFPAAFTPV